MYILASNVALECREPKIAVKGYVFFSLLTLRMQSILLALLRGECARLN